MIDQPGFRAEMHSVSTAVLEAGPYQVFVYVAPLERLTSAGFRDGLRLTNREHQRTQPGSDLFVPVTQEIYLTPTELAAPATLERSLQKALGLIPPDEREANAKAGKDDFERVRAFATQFAVKPPQVRTVAGEQPVLLRQEAHSRSTGPELATGTVLTQLQPEVSVEEFGGKTERWIRVQDFQGRRGYVRPSEVTPLP